jgi:hypothetical protein
MIMEKIKEKDYSFETINLGADSSNFITAYKDHFAAIWAWHKNLFIKQIIDGDFIDRDLLKVYNMQHGERVVSFIQHEELLVIGVDGMKSCKLIFCNLDANTIFIREYDQHSLIEIFSDEELIVITHNWENSPKTIIYIGVLNDLKRIVTIENVISAPFCMKHDNIFILCWIDRNNLLKVISIDISTNTIKRFEDTSQTMWCYTVGTYDDDRFYIGGFIPYNGTEIYIFDYDLNVIENFIMESKTPTSPNMFNYKIPLLSLEPYQDEYNIFLYDMKGNFIQQFENALSPSFAVDKNGNKAMILYIKKGSTLKLEYIKPQYKEFNFL